jgi:hypothetical protein
MLFNCYPCSLNVKLFATLCFVLVGCSNSLCLFSAVTMKSLLALLLLSIVVNINAQIYFILEEGQVRCFLEEVPKDTLVIGRYRTEEEGTGMARSGIKVTVTDPEGNIAMQRDMNPSGRFAFTSAQEGEFKLCFQTNSSRWFGARQRIVSLNERSYLCYCITFTVPLEILLRYGDW